MGASEGLRILYGHISDLTLPLFSLQLRVHRDQWEFSTVGQPVFVLDTLLVSVQIIIPFVLSLYRILILFLIFSGSDLRSRSGYAFLGQS